MEIIEVCFVSVFKNEIFLSFEKPDCKIPFSSSGFAMELVIGLPVDY